LGWDGLVSMSGPGRDPCPILVVYLLVPLQFMSALR